MLTCKPNYCRCCSTKTLPNLLLYNTKHINENLNCRFKQSVALLSLSDNVVHKEMPTHRVLHKTPEEILNISVPVKN